MGNFLSAFHIHIIPRDDGAPLDEPSAHSARQKMIQLIAKICKDYHGVVLDGFDEKIVYTFNNVNFATHASVAIEIEADSLNAKNHSSPICLTSIGIVSLINPFTGLREDERSVQLASFMAEAAGPGELYLSEGAYESLANPEELLCRFTRQLMRTGEDRALNAYVVFWSPTEVDLGKLHKDPEAVDLEIQPIRSFGLKLVSAVLLLFLGVLLLTVGYESLWAWFIQMVYR
ncbi:hypothetical protein ICN19_09665 [Polynucleobacter sp. AP-Capit-er-40B-B4]|uniref:hypothetical protein n=1 Tax=Polynucleobacter sp. AP-Capit-er-40B-B4 TaxID=2576927 RepID=UPI001C0BF08C|nr:hypothetical protein [Polynucleobacter sp. AP-Capit-er-40B-B4]MBU3582274.1 hypothetical protein [Polynucleobacter sp. AP-Capit-er-40B-B4]